MKVACSPDSNFESRLDPKSPPGTVVVVELAATAVVVVDFAGAAVVAVVELTGLVVVVVVVLALEHPAATIPTAAANTKPVTTRRCLKFLASLIIWVLPPSSHPLAGGSVPQEWPPGTALKCCVRLAHGRPSVETLAPVVEASQTTKYLAIG
jgi:hypothetical protein